MKSVLSILLILFAIGMHNAFASESTSLNEKLLQLGQTPAEHPVPFAPSLLKNEITADTHVELHGTPVFLPDGRCFFIEMQQKDSETDRYRKTIMAVQYRDGAWQEMKPAPFSGTWNDGTITLSPDGNRLYFSSDRPVPEKRTWRWLWRSGTWWKRQSTRSC